MATNSYRKGSTEASYLPPSQAQTSNASVILRFKEGQAKRRTNTLLQPSPVFRLLGLATLLAIGVCTGFALGLARSVPWLDAPQQLAQPAGGVCYPRSDGRACAEELPLPDDNRQARLFRIVTDVHARLPPRRRRRTTRDPVLVLTVLKDHVSYGIASPEDYNRQRNFADHLALLAALGHPPDLLSTGLLITDGDEYQRVRCALAEAYAPGYHHEEDSTLAKACRPAGAPAEDVEMLVARLPRLAPFRDVLVIFRPGLLITDAIVNRANRHDEPLQRVRRSLIARARNTVLLTALTPEHTAVLWVDADMLSIPEGLLGRMLRSGKDILMPMTGQGGMIDYDKNGWVLPRTEPNEAQRRDMERGIPFIPESRFVPETKLISDLLKDTPRGGYARVDSVGGTVLFVRAEVHRQGAIFPPIYIIGAEWQFEGYDGIETEGLCYVAKKIGFECWAMPYEHAMHALD